MKTVLLTKPVMYTRSKLWQRPVGISKDIIFLLNDRRWGPHIDSNWIAPSCTNALEMPR